MAVRVVLSISLALVITVVAGCATGRGGAVGVSHAPREERPIELSLRTTDGRVVELTDQHGSPVLLFLFATYDGASVAIHRELTRFARDHMDTVVLAVAIQPDAATFATAFAETQAPPYTVTYEDGESIVRGVSELGPLEAIPTLIMIDAHGRECARHVGYASARVIGSMHEIAVSRGGIVAAEEPAPAETAETPAPPQPEPAPEPAPEPEGPGPDEIVIEPD